jgi:GNAT superfamily N-acetyltransferase
MFQTDNCRLRAMWPRQTDGVDLASRNDFRIALVGDESLDAWRLIHNEIIPPDQLTLDDVTERAARNQMHVGWLDGQPVACSTIRPPQNDEVMLIVRVLPKFRREGLGSLLYAYLLSHPWVSSTTRLTTVVLAANSSGLQFALNRGFVQVDEYDVGDTTYIDLSCQRPLEVEPT